MYMQKTRNSVLLVLASLFGTLALAVAPVGAQHGNDTVSAESNTSTSNTSTAGDSSSGSGSDSKTATTTKTETETETEVHASNTESIREQAKKLLEAKRENHKESTAEHKKQACENHKDDVENRGKNYAAAAQRHLDVFNDIFTKVQAFHDSKNLNVTNYDTLLASALSKQAIAQTAVDNLKALNVTIDCTSTDPAGNVATLKTAVANARTALQDYRTAIKNLIVALKGASTAQTTNSTTNTTTSTGGTR